ncbi:NAD+ synthase (glutamine-hydrolysing) [Lachnotalea glycerini]|uniref:Glutamine-dependent NAD(+) synthetase n=1 Tax=Lachnotalea glycerini TaxID=1763509 RepID=A0A255IM06_9FIRM|nr:NAD(+) synthase [Lachnotalea glycerini]PXV86256.1 NAD+ synthase (glutamine-hydrolysing) [Lachnotalea glycerini]RDY31571.1 NAD(+) synthase [Lachnotalea glycerini]
MKQGFVKVAAATPEIRVADCEYNRIAIEAEIDKALSQKAKLIVFPELVLTGYTCSDLFLQEQLLIEAKKQLIELAKYSKGKDILIFVGLPYERKAKLYNVTAAILNGEILGFIPKSHIPTYSEFYELRHFTKGNEKPVTVMINEKEVLFGTNLLFECINMDGFVIAGEICEDVWVPNPPSIRHAMAGATVIINSSASDETTGKDIYRRNLINGQSARLLCAYIYANAGEGESTTDLIFGGHNIISENGIALAESVRFQNETVYADIDIDRLRSERRRMTTFESIDASDYVTVKFSVETEETKLKRSFDNSPFVPKSKLDRDRRCEEILSMQSLGLKKRLKHTGCKHVVVGISGGLDSTLALLIAVRAFDSLNIKRENIRAITMPCFGTTDRTYHNAVDLIEMLNATFMEVNIKESVNLHFEDIGHDRSIHDITYENGQARERTQILMDVANQINGMVVGTGDMSELALGWATYNGDHMSMYGVNSSVPKTLVRHLVSYFADTCQDGKLSEVLKDILDTPVSPELLPPENGMISQKTEDIVGPYELHDFYLYYLLRFGYRPSKIYRIAKIAFQGIYEDETILKWLKIFYRRFFSQQFKRSCLPDGPKVGSIAVSPRGDLRMPSDACVRLWLEDLDHL